MCSLASIFKKSTSGRLSKSAAETTSAPFKPPTIFSRVAPPRRNVACSYVRGIVPAPIADLVPQMIFESLERGLPLLDRRWRGRFLKDAILAAPEARGSSPVRILRNELTRETPGIEGLYPVGEGAATPAASSAPPSTASAPPKPSSASSVRFAEKGATERLRRYRYPAFFRSSES